MTILATDYQAVLAKQKLTTDVWLGTAKTALKLDLDKAACIQKAIPKEPEEVLKTYKDYVEKH